MKKLTEQDKEFIILDNICECVKHIKELGLVSENINKYHFNFGQLFESVSHDYKPVNNTYKIDYRNNNPFAYFQKMQDFLDGFETNTQHVLNESLMNEQKFGIIDFKQDLKRIIEQLKKQNDIGTLSNDIVKIKAFAKIPIRIYGFDIGYSILSNAGLMTELDAMSKSSYRVIVSIVYNKSTSDIYIVDLNRGLFAYQIKDDKLVQLECVKSKLSKDTYLDILKEITGYNNLIEIYTDHSNLDFKYSDNLYQDVKQQLVWKQYQESIKIAK